MGSSQEFSRRETGRGPWIHDADPTPVGGVDLSRESFSGRSQQTIAGPLKFADGRGDTLSRRTTTAPSSVEGLEIREGGWRYHAAVATLNSKNILRSVVYLGLYGLPITTILPSLTDSMPWALILGGLGHFAYTSVRDLVDDYKDQQEMLRREASLHGDVRQRGRITEVTADLCAANNIPMPFICTESGAPRVYNRLFRQDILCMSAHSAKDMEDRVLRAVIAHELAHVGNTELYLRRIGPILNFCSWPAVLFAAAEFAEPILSRALSPLYSAMDGLQSIVLQKFPALCSAIGFVEPISLQGLSMFASFGAAALAAAGSWELTHRVGSALLNWNQQDAELRTDLRSVRLSGDPIGVVVALEEDLDRCAPGPARRAQFTEDQRANARRGISTHPAHQDRIEFVARVFFKG